MTRLNTQSNRWTLVSRLDKPWLITHGSWLMTDTAHSPMQLFNYHLDLSYWVRKRSTLSYQFPQFKPPTIWKTPPLITHHVECFLFSTYVHLLTALLHQSECMYLTVSTRLTGEKKNMLARAFQIKTKRCKHKLNPHDTHELERHFQQRSM